MLLKLLVSEVGLAALPAFELLSVFHVVSVAGSSLSSWKDPRWVATLTFVFLWLYICIAQFVSSLVPLPFDIVVKGLVAVQVSALVFHFKSL